jgi:hypothetical protein
MSMSTGSSRTAAPNDGDRRRLAEGNAIGDAPVSGQSWSSRASAWLSLYGPLVFALYFVATSRWGSYLLPGPPYIGDVALAGLIVHRIWTLVHDSTPKPLLSRELTLPAALLLLLSVGWLAAGDWTVTAARDAAPYMYVVLVFFGQSHRAIPARTITRLVYGALIFHAAWYTAGQLFPGISESVATLGDGQVFLLAARGDIDGALIAILAAMALGRTFSGRRLLPSAAVSAWALTLVLLNQSRASLLATVGVFAFLGLRHLSLWMAARSTPVADRLARVTQRAPMAVGLAVLLLVPVGVTVISGTPQAFERTVNVVRSPAGGGSSDDGGAGGSGEGQAGEDGGAVRPRYSANTGVGTFDARKDAWGAVIEWIHDDGVTRAVLGVGFGPHYMQQSGADVLLLGPYADPAVRSVHNYAVNTWARLGAVGLLLISAITVLALVAAFRLATRARKVPDLDLFAALLVVAIPITALLGVVLEGPYAAIPYFWAVGYLASRAVEEGIWRPLRLPERLRS